MWLGQCGAVPNQDVISLSLGIIMFPSSGSMKSILKLPAGKINSKVNVRENWTSLLNTNILVGSSLDLTTIL